ncbi:hypothetical protein HELRODRAFT_176527 [Helobdella robusta]|uniref:Uncharacterized protein n=1 Tax=Helobdella robusta TaxID=6412 RepID=T1FAM3_HELRO|nr:hypothetical protein HELRODRAFT_176527 [Helobdella robusta]ESN99765.1 hypothetical protein HELRODRAFT_176527 [Helobdella robusta]
MAAWSFNSFFSKKPKSRTSSTVFHFDVVEEAKTPNNNDTYSNTRNNSGTPHHTDDQENITSYSPVHNCDHWNDSEEGSQKTLPFCCGLSRFSTKKANRLPTKEPDCPQSQRQQQQQNNNRSVSLDESPIYGDCKKLNGNNKSDSVNGNLSDDKENTQDNVYENGSLDLSRVTFRQKTKDTEVNHSKNCVIYSKSDRSTIYPPCYANGCFTGSNTDVNGKGTTNDHNDDCNNRNNHNNNSEEDDDNCDFLNDNNKNNYLINSPTDLSEDQAMNLNYKPGVELPKNLKKIPIPVSSYNSSYNSSSNSSNDITIILKIIVVIFTFLYLVIHKATLPS